MTDIRTYMKENRELIDDMVLPEGDLDVFLKKADTRRHRTVVLKWTSVLLANAACLALIVSVAFRQMETPESVYDSYLSFVNDARQTLIDENADQQWISTLDGVTFESVPMIDLLPEELSKKEKVGILQDHYSRLRNGAKTILNDYKRIEL